MLPKMPQIYHRTRSAFIFFTIVMSIAICDNIISIDFHPGVSTTNGQLSGSDGGRENENANTSAIANEKDGSVAFLCGG